MRQAPNRKKSPQIVLVLRAAGGAYLLYLAWDLREAVFAENGTLFLVAAAVFALVGAALVITSVRLLVKGEFLRPWETGAEDHDPKDPDDPEDPL